MEELNAIQLMSTTSMQETVWSRQERTNSSGKMSCMLEHGSKSTLQGLFVVKQLNQNLLGLPAIEPLEIIKRVDTVA